MPLSEDEQRILSEIERSFYEHDPEFAGRVKSETIYRHAGRNCKYAAAGFLASLVVLVFTFASYPLLGFAAFLGMVLCAIVFERNLRKMGRVGLQQVSESLRARGLPGALGDTRRRLRERFKRDD